MMQFGHIAIRVKDIAKMLHFYCDGLGLAEAFRILNDDGSLRIVFLHIAQGQYLELCLGGLDKPTFNDETSLGFRHISFTVDDLAKFKDEMEAKGIIFDSGILKLRDNNLALFFFDPEGNKLEVVQIQLDSPHQKFLDSNFV